MLLVDATTAQHTRGIGTVIQGIVRALPEATSGRTVVVAGPKFESIDGVKLRRLAVAKTRPGRLLYQRLLLPLDISRLHALGDRVERVLLLDSYLPLVRPQRDVRYASFVHDLLPLTHPHYWPAAKLAVKRAAFGSLRRSGATIFTSSDHNADQIRRRLGVDALVVRYGCGQLADAEADAARTAPLPQQEPYLLYLGSVEPRKDVLGLLDAFELAATSLDPVPSLVILGDGPAPYAAAVRRKIAQSRNSGLIQLEARADRETALRRLKHASALLFPTHAEGFGLPILEALALGTPVVASDLPEIRAWAGDAILYAPPGRPADWVGPIRAASAAGATHRRVGQELAAGYRWRKAAEEVVTF